MKFKETKLKGAYIIDVDRVEDERGFFARTFDEKEFERYGLKARFVQCSVSFNKKKGTLRGMHYQLPPHVEAKLVHCAQGAIYDVIIDLRIDSSTYKKWVAVELMGDNYRMLYVPEGFAHGFQTLVDNTGVFYQISEYYHPESVAGVRWDDPAFGIKWPIKKEILSKRDSAFIT